MMGASWQRLKALQGAWGLRAILMARLIDLIRWRLASAVLSDKVSLQELGFCQQTWDAALVSTDVPTDGAPSKTTHRLSATAAGFFGFYFQSKHIRNSRQSSDVTTDGAPSRTTHRFSATAAAVAGYFHSKHIRNFCHSPGVSTERAASKLKHGLQLRLL